MVLYGFSVLSTLGESGELQDGLVYVGLFKAKVFWSELAIYYCLFGLTAFQLYGYKRADELLGLKARQDIVMGPLVKQ